MGKPARGGDPRATGGTGSRPVALRSNFTPRRRAFVTRAPRVSIEWPYRIARVATTKDAPEREEHPAVGQRRIGDDDVRGIVCDERRLRVGIEPRQERRQRRAHGPRDNRMNAVARRRQDVQIFRRPCVHRLRRRGEQPEISRRPAPPALAAAARPRRSRQAPTRRQSRARRGMGRHTDPASGRRARRRARPSRKAAAGAARGRRANAARRC